MRDRANILTSGAATLMNALIVPLFTFLFAVLYRPYGIHELMQNSVTTFMFNVVILFCIMLATISLMRGILYSASRKWYVSRQFHAVWCLGEIMVSALLVSIYVTYSLPVPASYFSVVLHSFGILFSICIFPYSLIWLAFELYVRHDDNIPSADDASLIRFYDKYRKLRFVVAKDELIFIKSEENYVQIHYLRDGRIRMFILRSSMLALEDTMTSHGLVRCHRCYFVNPSFIKTVHRDRSGVINAELTLEDYTAVPISRKYYDAITRLI